MKKLMIAAAIVCAAAFVQAASIDWGFSEQAYDANNPYALDGFSAYLFTESAWTTAVAEGITADTFDSALDYASLQKTTGGSSKTYTKWATGVPETWTADTAASGNYIVALFNGNEYVASDAIAADAYVSSQESHLSASWSIKASATPLSKSDFTAVPEPTSGLLLLLGVAGLALRRRRA